MDAGLVFFGLVQHFANPLLARPAVEAGGRQHPLDQLVVGRVLLSAEREANRRSGAYWPVPAGA